MSVPLHPVVMHRHNLGKNKMTLADLKHRVNLTYDAAVECGRDPAQIPVSLQIDGPETSSVWTTDADITWDDDGSATGCVLHGERTGSHSA